PLLPRLGEGATWVAVAQFSDLELELADRQFRFQRFRLQTRTVQVDTRLLPSELAGKPANIVAGIPLPQLEVALPPKGGHFGFQTGYLLAQGFGLLLLGSVLGGEPALVSLFACGEAGGFHRSCRHVRKVDSRCAVGKCPQPCLLRLKGGLVDLE